MKPHEHEDARCYAGSEDMSFTETSNLCRGCPCLIDRSRCKDMDCGVWRWRQERLRGGTNGRDKQEGSD